VGARLHTRRQPTTPPTPAVTHDSPSAGDAAIVAFPCPKDNRGAEGSPPPRPGPVSTHRPRSLAATRIRSRRRRCWLLST